MNKKWVLTATLSLAVVATAAWLLLGRSTTRDAIAASAPPPEAGVSAEGIRFAADSPQLAMIRTAQLPSTPVPVTDALNARLAYDEDLTAHVGTPVAGRITSLKAAPGDKVKAGQLLAEIDSPDAGTAIAELEKARAEVQQKQLALARADELGPGEAISRKDYEAARADLEQARAEAARATLRLKQLGGAHAVQGQKIRIVSPIDGVVMERAAALALEVSPGSPASLFVISNAKRLWLWIDLPEKLLPRIRQGSHVVLETDTWPGEQFQGTVTQLGQVIDTSTRRAALRARVDNPAGKLLPEMFVRAAILQESGSGVRVPNTALVNEGIYTYAFVQSAPGTFQRRPVTLLTRGEHYSYVGDGLAGDEHVVTAGAMLLDAEYTARLHTQQ